MTIQVIIAVRYNNFRRRMAPLAKQYFVSLWYLHHVLLNFYQFLLSTHFYYHMFIRGVMYVPQPTSCCEPKLHDHLPFPVSFNAGKYPSFLDKIRITKMGLCDLILNFLQLQYLFNVLSGQCARYTAGPKWHSTSYKCYMIVCRMVELDETSSEYMWLLYIWNANWGWLKFILRTMIET